MVAYAKAESVVITPPSGSLPRVFRGSSSAQYVPVLFDIVVAYHSQVFAAAQTLPTFVVLEWVTRKDEKERGIWVEQFQNSTLGTHPRRGPSSSTIIEPSAAARQRW